MKKIILLLLVLMLSISSVIGDVVFTANSSTVISQTEVTLSATLNETSNMTIVVAKDLALTNKEFQYTEPTGATSFNVNVQNLRGGTTYYWQINASSEESDTTVSMGVATFTTKKPTLSGLERIVVTFITLFLEVGLIYFLLKTKKNILTLKVLAQVIIILIVSVIIIIISTSV